MPRRLDQAVEEVTVSKGKGQDRLSNGKILSARDIKSVKLSVLSRVPACSIKADVEDKSKRPRPGTFKRIAREKGKREGKSKWVKVGHQIKVI